MDRSDGAAPDLVHAFVAAYVPYVQGRLADLGVEPPDGFGAALDTGRSWLEAELRALLAVPPGRQRRSPLEIFQEALTEPTRALEAAGVAPAERDPAAIAALPGDVYDLAPASSQVLGEQAWRVHVAWGIAKAQAVAGVVPAAPAQSGAVQPLAVLVGTDLMDRTRIEAVAHHAGFDFAVWRNPAAVDQGLADSRPAVVLIDLSHRAADDAIRACTAAGVRTIAFGPHVDDVALARARSLGAMDAVARSRFFSKLEAYLQAMV